MNNNAEKLRNACLKIFSSDDGKILMNFLIHFTRADEAEYCVDPRKDAYLQGRKSVVCELKKIMHENYE